MHTCAWEPGPVCSLNGYLGLKRYTIIVKCFENSLHNVHYVTHKHFLCTLLHGNLVNKESQLSLFETQKVYHQNTLNPLTPTIIWKIVFLDTMSLKLL